MVEFTLIFPVLAILLFGVIQFGIAFNNYLALTDAVRAGSRQAAVARYLPDPQRVPKVESKVRASASNLNQSKLKVFVTTPLSDRYAPPESPFTTAITSAGSAAPATFAVTVAVAVAVFGLVSALMATAAAAIETASAMG